MRLANTRLQWIAICFAIGFVDCDLAMGQVPYRRYASPSGPTITPYLNYFRTDFGGVGDPYNQFIAPRRQLDYDLYDLERQQRADFQATQRQLQQVVREPTSAPTGTGAWFMNYSHYYRAPQVAPRGR